MKLHRDFFSTLCFILISTVISAQYILEAHLKSEVDTLAEGCSDMIVFSINPAAEENLSLDIEITGTALKGTDYNISIGTSLLFLKGEMQITHNIIPIVDGFNEGVETVVLTVKDSVLESSFTFTLSIAEEGKITINAVGDTIQACRNAPINVSASGNPASFKWFPSNLVTDSVGQSTSLLPTEDRWFYVVGNVGTCTIVDSVYVNLIDPRLDIFTTDDTAYCLHGTLELNANTNFPENFTWNNTGTLDDPTSLTPTAVVDENTLYIGTLKFYNCTIRDSLYVRVDSLPDTELLGIPSTGPTCNKYCKGDVIKITDNAHVMEELFPHIEYQWNRDPTIVKGIDTLQSILVQLDTTRTYYRTTINGKCMTKDSILILVIDTELNLFPSDTTVCADMPVQVIAFPTEGLTDIEWKPETGLSCTDCLEPLIKTSETRTYTVKATKDGCCPVEASITVNVKIPPIPIAPVLTCPGEPVQINVGEDSLNLSNPLWSGDVATLDCKDCFDPIASPPSPRVYVLSAYDEEGCLNRGFAQVSFYDSIDATLDVEPSLSVSIGAQVTVTLMTDPQVNDQDFIWLYNGSITDQKERKATFSINNKGTENVITVIYLDNNGCERKATVVITGKEPDVDIPNAFTPDGDESNDYFRPLFKNSPVPGELIKEFIIVNRFGKVVYNNESPQGWDGRIHGMKKAPPDVYLYRVTLILPNGVEYKAKGDVTLIR